jgi:hypothetical protein
MRPTRYSNVGAVPSSGATSVPGRCVTGAKVGVMQRRHEFQCPLALLLVAERGDLEVGDPSVAHSPHRGGERRLVAEDGDRRRRVHAFALEHRLVDREPPIGGELGARLLAAAVRVRGEQERQAGEDPGLGPARRAAASRTVGTVSSASVRGPTIQVAAPLASVPASASIRGPRAAMNTEGLGTSEWKASSRYRARRTAPSNSTRCSCRRGTRTCRYSSMCCTGRLRSIPSRPPHHAAVGDTDPEGQSSTQRIVDGERLTRQRHGMAEASGKDCGTDLEVAGVRTGRGEQGQDIRSVGDARRGLLGGICSTCRDDSRPDDSLGRLPPRYVAAASAGRVGFVERPRFKSSSQTSERPSPAAYWRAL